MSGDIQQIKHSPEEKLGKLVHSKAAVYKGYLESHMHAQHKTHTQKRPAEI